MTKNSEIAKSGFLAEEIFQTDCNIKLALEIYFGKKIIAFSKIHGEKYDTTIQFEDNTCSNIQIKKIEKLDGRGDSFDRRHIKDTFQNQFIRKYLTLLTIIRPSKRKTIMTNEQKKDFIKLCNNNIQDIQQYLQKTLLGIENNKNDYWCIMKTDNNFIKKELYIISSYELYNFIQNNIKIDIKLKTNGTCLYLSPYIILQRKGGGKTDHSPNHIQAKFKINQIILNLCEKIL